MVKSDDLLDPSKADSVGHVYYVAVARRAIAPIGVIRPTCPVREKCWIAASNNCDYRADHIRDDIDPRGGSRASRIEENLPGRIELVSPLGGMR